MGACEGLAQPVMDSRSRHVRGHRRGLVRLGGRSSKVIPHMGDYASGIHTNWMTLTHSIVDHSSSEVTHRVRRFDQAERRRDCHASSGREGRPLNDTP